jgi:outer membrane protein assembly factor BamB
MIGTAKNNRAGLCAPAVALLAAFALNAADWPQWRGPDRNDVTSESSRWTGGLWAAMEAWRKDVGIGCASPIVAQGKVYALGWADGKDTLYCLDISGKEVWKQAYAAPKYGRHATGDQGRFCGPLATPAFDLIAGSVYSLGADGDLVCWDIKQGGQGRQAWHINLYNDYHAPRRPATGGGVRDYGYTASPLIRGDQLLIEVGAPEGTVMAFDKRSGKRLWTSACKDPAGHTGGPALITVQGLPCLAVVTLRQLVIVHLDEGRAGQTLAAYPWQTDFANSIASPAVVDDKVILTAGYNHKQTVLLQVAPDGIKKLWSAPQHSLVCTPVVFNKHVYMAYGKAVCLNLDSGKLAWTGASIGQDGSCLATADGRLVLLGQAGLVLAETADHSPDKYTELFRDKEVLRGKIVWPHVVYAWGCIFCKDLAGSLRCYGVQTAPGPGAKGETK